ncbi:MAG: hypothetical protein ACXWG0_07200 [Chthoniobacterales bacterium]
MQPEPKKPIQELLEASARARRAEFGADPQMPNPMRAQLHEEIARLARNEKPEERRSWLANFWPQLSLATAVAAMLVVASFVWLRTESRGPRVVESARPQRTTAPDDVSAPLHSLDAPQIDRLAKGNEWKSDEGTVAAAPPVQSEPSFAGGADIKSLNEVAQAPAAAKAAALAPAARSFAQTRQAESANVRQRFSQNVSGQIAGREDKLKQRANLLNTFDVQQEGNRIRVVDEDGSTYTGKLEQIAQSDSRSLSQKKEQNLAARSAAAFKRGEESESNEYFFRAAGFNSSLKKNVVFEANYIATPTAKDQIPGEKRSQTEQQQAPARIVGTARVAGEPPVEVDAVSVAR